MERKSSARNNGLKLSSGTPAMVTVCDTTTSGCFSDPQNSSRCVSDHTKHHSDGDYDLLQHHSIRNRYQHQNHREKTQQWQQKQEKQQEHQQQQHQHHKEQNCDTSPFDSLPKQQLPRPELFQIRRQHEPLHPSPTPSSALLLSQHFLSSDEDDSVDGESGAHRQQATHGDTNNFHYSSGQNNRIEITCEDQEPGRSRSKVPEEIRLRINSRERQRMHDLNSALDSLRQCDI
ncbi:putative uncharacterized protein DDB_G0288537 [Aplysia californica]|uniref:BHLH domain-containing protein n=1 Tax=Aplysia californica TaxID=6500 RepID=A0ABM0K4U5_APLCA|nr:putative uncharacterized protein DDB_G0288537 [Aplysia californica]